MPKKPGLGAIIVGGSVWIYIINSALKIAIRLMVNLKIWQWKFLDRCLKFKRKFHDRTSVRGELK